MKKTGLVVLGIVVLFGFMIMGKYNTLVGLDESVATAASQVENQYQRRLDLIPNLVSTVKGFAEQEKEVFVGVTEARANATKTSIDINDAESMAAFQQTQGELSSALSRLLVTVEAYPQLKSDQNFLELQAQLEGTENRISVERKNYNETVRGYNTTIRRFPVNIIAGLFGFEKAELFEAVEGSEVAPVVEF